QPVVQTSPGERALTELPPPWHEMDPQGGREPTSSQHQSPGKSARGPDGSHSTSATQDPSSSRSQAVTSKYTVFKSVKHGQGQVSTGWDFEPGDILLNTQYCYYRVPYKSGTDFVTMLARNGQMLPDIQMPDGMDAAKAAGDCVWFSGATADKKQS